MRGRALVGILERAFLGAAMSIAVLIAEQQLKRILHRRAAR